MTEIITFVIGAVFGLVGGVLPTILSNRREEKCLKREKVEELYSHPLKSQFTSAGQ